MRVSIIIPVLKINDYIRESIPKLLQLNYEDFEIIVLPDVITPDDTDVFINYPKVKLIASHESGPAFKRDLGARNASGEILAFLDDDAYPEIDWLIKAVRHFKGNNRVAAIGGPAITPESDSIRQKASGAIFTSKMGGGSISYRYWPGNRVMEVDDFPSVNLLIRKRVFDEIGGFDSKYWPGEDTKLCHDIISKGYKILYDPEVCVWHHRRSSLLKHLSQVWHYAIHRGFFMKRYPANSRHFNYFVPSAFTVFIVSGFLFFFISNFQENKILHLIYFGVLLIYLFLLLVSGIIEANRIKKIAVGILVIPAIFLTHLSYGVGFIVGLSRRKLDQ